jgi:cobalt-zinc-cadmium efflux system membrane fusion protein
VKSKFLFPILLSVLVGCENEKKVVPASFKLSETITKEMEFSTAEELMVQSELSLLGKISFDEDKVAKVFPLAGGFVKELKVELGDYVQKGQTLAVIRSPEIAGFTKDAIEAEAQFISAEKKLKITEELFKTGVISEVELFESRKDAEKAAGELERIKDVIDMYGAGKGAVYPIKSPVSGFLIQKNISQNMELRTEDISPVFIVASLTDVWVLANIYESDISKIKLGYDVEVTTISYPDRVFKGKIDKIFSLMDPESKTLKARITINNKNFDLKPDMFANIRVKYNENVKKIAIPVSALIFDKSRYYAMVYKSKDNIETREVEVYQENTSLAYIEKGINKGDKVIVRHQLLIYDALND